MESDWDIRGRVLVMDRDRARTARRCGRLTSAGWRASGAADEIELLAAARAGAVDIVLLQVAADELDGTDLANVLRAVACTPHLPVMVLAEAPSERARCRFLDAGADDVLSDGVSDDELSARLGAHMRVKVLQDELRSSRGALAASLRRERALLGQLRRDNAHLLTLCTTDPLTRLQNVRHFDSLLESEFKIARRYGRQLSVLVFDLDHFKVVNDTHGHPSGDYVLKEFAVILENCVRDSDIVARTGGEEFSVLLLNAGRDQAREFAQRIRNAASERKFIVHAQTIHVTTSIGSASYPHDAEIANERMLVYFADQALLRAKKGGRDRLVQFHDMPAAGRRRMRDKFLGSPPERYAPQAAGEALAEVRR